MARYVDTSFWIALALRRDQNHGAALELWSDGLGGLITSSLVVGETWTFIRRRGGHRLATIFLDSVDAHQSLIVRHVDEDVVEEAWEWLRRHDEKSYSFVDATSFALMRRLRPVEALVGGRAAHVLELDSQAPHLRLSPTQLGREIVEQVLDRGHENRGVGAFLIKLALRVPSRSGWWKSISYQ